MATLSAGQGSKGQRLYDWLLIDPGADAPSCWSTARSATRPSWPTTSATPPSRWSWPNWSESLDAGVEETLQFAKKEAGLYHYQIRKYHAW